MNQQKIEKAKLITATAELFNFNLSDAALAIYIETLESISVDNLKRILSYGIKTNAWRFMPRPGEILALVRVSDENQIKLKGKIEFDKILQHVRSRGRNAPIQLDYVSENALRQIGGIPRIADATDEDLVWLRKDFDNSFELLSEKKTIETRQNLIGVGVVSKDIKHLLSGIGKVI